MKLIKALFSKAIGKTELPAIPHREKVWFERQKLTEVQRAILDEPFM